MKTTEERLASFYEHAFFQEHKGLAEAIVDHEERTGILLPDTFHIPPFIRYENDEHFVLLGKVHTFYLFAMHTQNMTRYRLFENKAQLRLFFTQMAGKGIQQQDLAFWLHAVEDIEYNIQQLLALAKDKTDAQ